MVCVDKSEHAAGLAMARRLGLRVVIGETHREETLRAAGIDTCQALVSVTNSDIVNLETALHARGLAESPRVIVRLLDDDLAQRVQETISNTISRSVSYLAAPVFAAAMLDHQVLRTIAVGLARAGDRRRAGRAPAPSWSAGPSGTSTTGPRPGSSRCAPGAPSGSTGRPARITGWPPRTGYSCWPPGPG